jgi:septal ring factor EnvC (AmiA/AmiB activator)
LVASLLLCFAVFNGAALSSAEGQDDAVDLAARGEALKREIEELRRSFAEILEARRNHERAIRSAEVQLEELEAEKEILLEDLLQRRREVHVTLAALQRIALRPRAALLTSIRRPIDTLRGARLLSVALPTLEGRAIETESLLKELRDVKLSIVAERESLNHAVEELQREQSRVEVLIQRKTELLSVTEEDRIVAKTRAAALSRKAKDLRQLMKLATREAPEEAPRADERTESASASDAPLIGSEEEPTEESAILQSALALDRPEAVRFLDEAPGQLILPVDGEILMRFGETAKSGPAAGETSKGLTILSHNSARVVAPYDGRVVYAGPFRSYGQILIIDHGGRYHTLLAGLEGISAVVGQWLLAGEPVATMSSDTDRRPELYLELRRTGEAIDPLPWLDEIDSKVRG